MNTALLEKLLCLLDVRLQAVALCGLDPGTRLRFPPMDFVLVHYVLRGGGLLTSGDSAPLAFGPEALIFVPQKQCHDIFQEGAEDAPPVFWQEAAAPSGDGLIRLSPGGGAAILTACGVITSDCEGLDLFERFREPIAEDLSSSPAIKTALDLMQSELEEPRFGTRPLAEALMKQCLILAVRRQVERGDLRLLSLIGAHDPRLTKALVAILENPARDLSLTELAEISGMSRSVFAERFAEAFHRPPMDLVRQVRLHRAANLLRTTSLPVQVIAFSVGYASRSYFSRAFREAYGQDPKSFRRDAQERPAREPAHPTAAPKSDSLAAHAK